MLRVSLRQTQTDTLTRRCRTGSFLCSRRRAPEVILNLYSGLVYQGVSKQTTVSTQFTHRSVEIYGSCPRGQDQITIYVL